VAIEFSRPTMHWTNMRLCLEANVPVVVGTTGWYEHLAEVKAMVGAFKKGTLAVGQQLQHRGQPLLPGEPHAWPV
jgi:dihydrodipicolinate reductase